jgi:hypothetical protein
MENLPKMAVAVVELAGVEVSAWWLAEVKNS